METTTKLEIKVENDYKGQPNYLTTSLIDCMDFWNREGKMAVAKNRSGEWGSKETQHMANTMAADDFILQMLLIDCRTFINSEWTKKSGHKFECGRTRSHVWVHMDGERIFMLYV